MTEEFKEWRFIFVITIQGLDPVDTTSFFLTSGHRYHRFITTCPGVEHLWGRDTRDFSFCSHVAPTLLHNYSPKWIKAATSSNWWKLADPLGYDHPQGLLPLFPSRFLASLPVKRRHNRYGCRPYIHLYKENCLKKSLFFFNHWFNLWTKSDSWVLFLHTRDSSPQFHPAYRAVHGYD